MVSLSLTHFIAFSDTPLLSASAPRFRFVFSCANEAHAWGVSVRVSVRQGITAMGPAIALRPSPRPAPTPHPRWPLASDIAPSAEFRYTCVRGPGSSIVTGHMLPAFTWDHPPATTGHSLLLIHTLFRYQALYI